MKSAILEKIFWKKFWFCAALFISLLLVSSVDAITPEEVIDDPVLETRARNLSKQLRCLVCQNQSIDDSDADLARDLRYEIRQQIVAGATDKTILNSVRQRYGDYVLLNPPMVGSTMLLWLAPIAFIFIGLAIVSVSRRGSSATAQTELDRREQRQLNDLLKEKRAQK